ncbi:MAG: glucose-1-phosphate adenylyltransferase subunit GlgD [Lachnospiraceae bacterium]|nr:glucose-1-phosphate adenylyltransferase subunit GlgD [Lachnospiraceae bacterium]
MLDSNRSALGIIFPNTYDELVPELVTERLIASIPFAGRYRLIDFVISSMVNCGIDNISILVKEQYHSLLDHLGSGREWDLVRKNGGLNIFPPYAQKQMGGLNSGRVVALNSILTFLKRQKEKYVVITDTNVVSNFDYNALFDAHAASKADITCVYTKEPMPKEVLKDDDIDNKVLYYSYGLNANGRISKINVNPKDDDVQNLAMNIFVLERELLIKLIHEAYMQGSKYFERDVLIPNVDKLNIMGYEYKGYCARIVGLKSYFDENMKLLDEKNLDALFSNGQIYTKIRDDNPTRYIGSPEVDNALVADGCIIEGEVENSILFRGVEVEKGAKVKNCVLMQDTRIEAGAVIENVVTDKGVTITRNKEVKGTDTFPVYIAKNHSV